MPTNNMVLSPMQMDHVTREEFGEFKEEFRDFREETNGRFDEMSTHFEDEKKFVRDGFEGLGEQIDFVEKNLGDKIDTVDSKVTNINLDLHSLAGDVSWIKRSMTELVKKI
jgi:hypothetical protein